MNEVERYIEQVMANIHASASERERIGADLRAHLEEAVQAGEPAEAVIKRMGSPTEVAAEFMSQMTLRYASFWRRLGAFVVDTAIVGGVAAVLVLLGLLLFRQVPRNPLTWEWGLGGLMIVSGFGLGFAALGLFLLYFPILEGRFGLTIGKRLFGLVVVRESGLPIGYKEAFLRRLSFYLRISALDALFIPFTSKRQRAFDIVARTVVIRVEQGKYGVLTLSILLLIAVSSALGVGFMLRGSQVRLGWSGSREPARIAYSYQEFNGSERSSVRAQAGETILVDYQASVTSGKLAIKVINPKRDVVWLVQLAPSAENIQASVPVPAGLNGNYMVVIEGQHTSGSFDVGWEKK